MLPGAELELSQIERGLAGVYARAARDAADRQGAVVAPRLSKAVLHGEVKAAGLTDLQAPEVGAASRTDFLVASTADLKSVPGFGRRGRSKRAKRPEGTRSGRDRKYRTQISVTEGFGATPHPEGGRAETRHGFWA